MRPNRVGLALLSLLHLHNAAAFAAMPANDNCTGCCPVGCMVLGQESTKFEIAGAHAVLQFGTQDDYVTLIRNATEDELVCSGKIKATDVLIEGTSTTVADLIREFDALRTRMTAIEQFLGMMPPPPSSPPYPPSPPPVSYTTNSCASPESTAWCSWCNPSGGCVNLYESTYKAHCENFDPQYHYNCCATGAADCNEALVNPF